MKQVRNGVFETNSSSVHAISIDSSGREPSQFRLNEQGKIEISFGSFGRESRTYYSQYNKLSYLMTCLYYIAGDDKEAILRFCYGQDLGHWSREYIVSLCLGMFKSSHVIY